MGWRFQVKMPQIFQNAMEKKSSEIEILADLNNLKQTCVELWVVLENSSLSWVLMEFLMVFVILPKKAR